MQKRNTRRYTSFRSGDPFRKAGFLVLIFVQGVVMMSGSCRTKNSPATETKKEVPTEVAKQEVPAPTNEKIETSEIPPSKSAEIPAEKASSNKDTSIYSMVVAFFSPGDGIDMKTAREFDTYLAGYKTVNFNKVGWGREGETDFCIRLDNLSAGEVSKFKDGAEAILNKSKKVQIQYNAQCRHYRKR